MPREAPTLSGDALAAVRHRGSHMQIIASAGSGKTEVVSQRVADLLAEGVPPTGIVAFTFTERAAAELKNRIAERVEDRLGRHALDRLGGLFVGTIHAYCFRLLQQHVPRYETYDVLDDNQLTAFLSREASRLEIRQLDSRRPAVRVDRGVPAGVDVIENELLDPATMPDPFRTVLRDYFETLERYRLLTYGQQIVRAVHELEHSGLAASPCNASAPDRRRVPGRQPSAGTPHRTAHGASRASSASSATTTRRSTSGADPTCEHRRLRQALRRRRDVRDHDEPALASASDRHGQRVRRVDPGSHRQGDGSVPPVRGPTPGSRRVGRRHGGRRGRPDRLAHRPAHR